MTDPLAGQPAAAEAPAPQVPALTLADIEAVVRKSQEDADKRVAGIQSALGKQIQSLADENKRLKRSFTGEEDDGPSPREAELEAELARVQQEAALAAAQREFPDVFEDYMALTGRQTPAEQLAYLRESRQKLTAPPPVVEEEPAEDPPTPRVHPNQPARDPKGWTPGMPMDLNTANELFKGLTEWPGYPQSVSPR